MDFKFRKIVKAWERRFASGEAKIEDNAKAVLKITLDGLHLADLYHDGSDYCLIYKKDFIGAGLPAFNPEDLKSSEVPVVDFCYRSKDLWFVFAERLGSLKRRDFAEELKKHGLNSESDPIILLGKVGQISISKPWRLEIVKKTS